MTPAEWNSGGSWGRMTPQMNADLGRLAAFVSDLPLAQWNPSRLQIESSDPQVRGWGVAGEAGGLIWVQDFSLQGHPIEEIRANEVHKRDVQLEVMGLAAGSYTITPYDTWLGNYRDPFEVTCTDGQPCTLALPMFLADMAFRIERK
jgi:hypothetical protein